MLTKEQLDKIAKENKQITTIPTLDQLLSRLTLTPQVVRYYFRLVACGGIGNATLTGDNAILAAQAMTILFKHIEDISNAAAQKTSDSSTKEVSTSSETIPNREVPQERA